jgi:hypothetical protein
MSPRQRGDSLPKMPLHFAAPLRHDRRMRVILVLAAALSLVACTRENPENPHAPETSGGAIMPQETRPVPAGGANLPPDTPVSAPAQTSEAADADEAGDCGADKLGRWLNVLPTADVKAQIAATVGKRPIRYIAPGDAVTMDYSPSRLNVELGEDGRIKRFRCG